MLEHERHDRDIFATLCVVSIAPDHREFEIRMAGHPWPILIDRDGARQLAGPTRAPLGVSPAQEWPRTRIRPEGEWSLLLYTDGLIEGHIGEGPERLGSARLVELISEIGPGEPMRLDRLKDTGSIVATLIDRVRALAHNDLSDDVAALWLSVNPDEPSSQDHI
jgi:serine phosphatase RsbU (regulator of sigma subunit)